jgi:hypothetical protein
LKRRTTIDVLDLIRLYSALTSNAAKLLVVVVRGMLIPQVEGLERLLVLSITCGRIIRCSGGSGKVTESRRLEYVCHSQSKTPFLTRSDETYRGDRVTPNL